MNLNQTRLAEKNGYTDSLLLNKDGIVLEGKMSRSEKIAKMATTTAGQAKQNSTISKKRKKARKGVLLQVSKIQKAPNGLKIN